MFGCPLFLTEEEFVQLSAVLSWLKKSLFGCPLEMLSFVLSVPSVSFRSMKPFAILHILLLRVNLQDECDFEH